MRHPVRALLAGFLILAAPRPAVAVQEWYDFYLQARDRDIPAQRWADCVKNLREALRLRPEPANNVRLYGMQFEHYLPHYHMGLCRLRQEDYAGAIAAFNRSEELGAVKKSPQHAQLIRLRAEAQSAEAARLTRRARGEVQRLLQRAQELGRRQAWEESLPLLAQAE